MYVIHVIYSVLLNRLPFVVYLTVGLLVRYVRCGALSCIVFLRTSRIPVHVKLVGHCCQNGNNVEATFNFVEATFDFVERIVRLVAFDNVALTFLLVDAALRMCPYWSVALSMILRRLSSSVTPHGGPAGGFTRAGQATTSCRLQSYYSSTVTLHGGPVGLRS